MPRFIPSTLLALTMLLLGPPRRAEAHELKHTAGGTAVSWRAADVEWTVDASVRKVPGAEDAVIAAAAAWSGRGGAPSLAVSQVDADLKPGLDGKNGVFFVESGFPPVGDALAVTVLSFDADTGEVLDADILLNGNYRLGIVTAPVATGNADLTVAPAATSAPVAADAPYDVRRVLAHEMGHALALSDELHDTSALMYPYIPRGVSLSLSPASDDVAGLATLYEAGNGAAAGAAAASASTDRSTAGSATGCSVATGPSAPRGSPAMTLASLLAIAVAAVVRGRRRSELLVRTVHDVKNPLAVVRSALEWLEVELADREEAVDAVRDASTAASRLMSIVDDLALLARLETDDALRDEALDLTTIIGNVTATASARLAARDITVSSTAPVALQMNGDAELLTRSLDALIDASARGVPPGTCIELAARVTNAEQATGATIEVIEIEIGQRGTVAAGPETDALDAFGTGGLGPYLAQEAALLHGGSLVVIPTSTMPRALLRLPR